jgi:hypothetical protein
MACADAAVWRRTLWHHEQSVDNSAGAVRRVAEVTATRPDGGTNNAAVTARHKGALFIPPPVEVVTHDDDGNQTSNAHWSYTWDGENRMIAAEESLAILLQPPGSGPVKRQRIECAYDAQGRRIYKRVLTAEGTSTNFVLKQSLVFLYDGWNMIAEIDTTTSARLIRSYEWGHRRERHHRRRRRRRRPAGSSGIIQQPSTSNQQRARSRPCYDGNGNVTELINLATGGVSARYEYVRVRRDDQRGWRCHRGGESDPVQHEVSRCGDGVDRLYAERYYDRPNDGRWLSRDPIGEQGWNESLRDGWQ